MGCGESLYNYINRQIKKISEKQHNFIVLQDRVNTNIFVKLNEINEKLLDIGQNNNVDSILNELEKLTTELNNVKENVSSNTTKLNETTNMAQTNANSISNLKDKFDDYEANTDTKIETINNTLNSVEVKTLNVNTASFANVQQFIFQKKIVNIVGLFRTAHYQSGDSQLIQIKNPYPSRIVHFVACDRNTGKALGCYITQSGIINIPLNYEGEKDIYLNVCYVV